jgi:RimJ/RimL family protein N-acetyltransferase
LSQIRAEPFETQRLHLDPLTEDHADLLVAVLSDPALHKFIGGQPDTLDELRARYRRITAGSPDQQVSWCNWAVLWKPELEPIGTLQATIVDQGEEVIGEIAGVISTAWQNRGIAREIARALLSWLSAREVTRVIAHVHPEHRASSAVVAALGLKATPVRVDGEVEWELGGRSSRRTPPVP